MARTVNKPFYAELGRFIVTAVVTLVIDYFVNQLFLWICNGLPSVWATVIATAMGFIISVIPNYFLSTYWVYKRVTERIKKESKTASFIVKFVLLSLAALLISVLFMWLAQWTCEAAWGLDISSEYGRQSRAEFWAYLVCFILKSAIALLFNYFTRKFVLYKSDTSKEHAAESMEEFSKSVNNGDEIEAETTKKSDKEE
ncbi:MAG: GtrA family protein [Coprobacillus sp.]|nr:GtrA family protein [Coprobacillus sp.]